MTGLELKNALTSGKRVIGTLLEGISNPKQLLWYQQTGIDFVFIDNEHNPLDRNMTAYACKLFAHSGIAPLVRIPHPDLYQASMVMDGGAHGIIVPYVESVQEVLDVVAAVKYRPLKGRALGTLLQTGAYPSNETKDYIKLLNQNGVVVIMLESVAGMGALDELLDVASVDAVLIGPNDLSVSLGVPDMYDHPLFVSAAKEIMDKTLAKGKGFGIHFNDFALHKKWTPRGQNFVAYASDTYGAYTYIKEGVSALRVQAGS